LRPVLFSILSLPKVVRFSLHISSDLFFENIEELVSPTQHMKAACPLSVREGQREPGFRLRRSKRQGRNMPAEVDLTSRGTHHGNCMLRSAFVIDVDRGLLIGARIGPSVLALPELDRTFSSRISDVLLPSFTTTFITPSSAEAT
jgi:hypothetical protein